MPVIEIQPLVGAGPFNFGMSFSECAAALREHFEEEPKGNDARITAFEGSLVLGFYKKKLAVIHFSHSTGPSKPVPRSQRAGAPMETLSFAMPRLGEIDLFGGPQAEVVASLSQLGVPFSEPETTQGKALFVGAQMFFEIDDPDNSPSTSTADSVDIAPKDTWDGSVI